MSGRRHESFCDDTILGGKIVETRVQTHQGRRDRQLRCILALSEVELWEWRSRQTFFEHCVSHGAATRSTYQSQTIASAFHARQKFHRSIFLVAQQLDPAWRRKTTVGAAVLHIEIHRSIRVFSDHGTTVRAALSSSALLPPSSRLQRA